MKYLYTKKKKYLQMRTLTFENHTIKIRFKEEESKKNCIKRSHMSINEANVLGFFLLCNQNHLFLGKEELNVRFLKPRGAWGQILVVMDCLETNGPKGTRDQIVIAFVTVSCLSEFKIVCFGRKLTLVIFSFKYFVNLDIDSYYLLVS